jgi:hypothetical protein
LAAEEQEKQAEDTKQDAEQSFEKARDALRARDERERSRQEASEKPVDVDPYTMPLVPEQPTGTIPTIAVMSVVSRPES